MNPQTPAVNLSDPTVRELLQLSRRASLELRLRGLIRTDNAPLGDIVEYIVCRAYQGVLNPNSEKSYDLVDAERRRIQVEARTLTAPHRSSPWSDGLLSVQKLRFRRRSIRALRPRLDGSHRGPRGWLRDHRGNSTIYPPCERPRADFIKAPQHRRWTKWRDITELTRGAYAEL